MAISNTRGSRIPLPSTLLSQQVLKVKPTKNWLMQKQNLQKEQTGSKVSLIECFYLDRRRRNINNQYR